MRGLRAEARSPVCALSPSAAFRTCGDPDTLAAQRRTGTALKKVVQNVYGIGKVNSSITRRVEKSAIAISGSRPISARQDLRAPREQVSEQRHRIRHVESTVSVQVTR